MPASFVMYHDECCSMDRDCEVAEYGHRLFVSMTGNLTTIVPAENVLLKTQKSV